MSFTDGDNLSQARARRLQESIPVSYTIYKDGSTYRAESCISGLPDQSSSTAATVIHNAWDAMTSGGRIHFVGDIDLGTTPLALKLSYLTKGLMLTGEGETRSKLTYTGTGYAITVDTDDGAIGQYGLLLSDFQLTGSTKTAGRHGIKVSEVGQWGGLKRLFIRQMDTAVNIDDTNTLSVDCLRCRTCNTGISVTNNVNALNLKNLRMLGITNYGIHITDSVIDTSIEKLVTDSVGTAIYVDNAAYARAFNVNSSYLSCSTADIHLLGTDWTDSIRAVTINNCYFESSVTSHIIPDYVKQLRVTGCYSNNATNFIAPAAHFNRLIHEESNVVEDTNLCSDLNTVRVSPTWSYMDYSIRMNWMNHIYYDSATNYLIAISKNNAHTIQGHDDAASWLTNSVVGYGTYEWKAKFGPRDTNNDGKIVFGLEKHHGHPTEGIIVVYDYNKPADIHYYFYTDSDAGTGPEKTDLDAHIAANTEYTFRIQWDDTPRVKLSINGVQRADHSTHVPTASMQLFGESTIETGDSSADQICYWKSRSFKRTTTFP